MKANVSFYSPSGWGGAGVVSGLHKTEGSDTETAISGGPDDSTAHDGTVEPDEQQGGPLLELGARDDGESSSRLGCHYLTKLSGLALCDYRNLQGCG